MEQNRKNKNTPFPVYCINGATGIGASKEEFLNLLKSLPEQIENATIAEKDSIARIMILNLTIDEQKGLISSGKSPLKPCLNARNSILVPATGLVALAPALPVPVMLLRPC